MKPKKKSTETDMTPMIDVVFLLIIFFLLNQFKIIEGHLDVFLPKDSGQAFSRPVDQEEIKDMRIFALERGDSIELSLDQFLVGRYPKEMVKWGNESWSGYIKGKDGTEGKLQALINQIYDDYKKKLLPQLVSARNSGVKLDLVINIDPNVPYVFAVGAINTCFDAGIEDIKFAGQKRRLVKVDDGVIAKFDPNK